ncbi:MAG: hypothetical protein RLY14_1073 [Planctomycetota bacterium]
MILTDNAKRSKHLIMFSQSLIDSRYRSLSAAILVLLLTGCPTNPSKQSSPEPSTTSSNPLESTTLPAANTPPDKEKEIIDPLKIVESTPEQLIARTEDGKAIGRGLILRPQAGWPPTIMLQLPLRGLESLKIVSNSNVAEISVSSHGDLSTTVKLNDSQYKTSDLDNQLVQVMPEAGSPKTIPLPEGSSFQVRIPSELTSNNPDQLEVNWIDFYR